MDRNGHAVRINKITSHAGKAVVYNFEVEGDHNYYITDAQLLVHNCPVSSRAARRESMRRANIPTSRAADRQTKNASGRQYEYDQPGGGVNVTSHQTMDRNHKGAPHWESGPAKREAEPERKYGRLRHKNGKSKVEY